MSWKNVQYENGKFKTGAGGGGSSTYAGLDDVNLSNVQDGQIPKYNSTTQKWENEENSLANLSDTSILTLSDKQVLSYNARTQKWENRFNSVSRLSDVSLNSPSDGDILRYNAQSGEWENAVMPDSYHVYSTTDQQIGEWIDGKPLYEKTVSFTLGTRGAYNTYDTGIANPKKMIIDYGSSFYENTNYTSGVAPYVYAGADMLGSDAVYMMAVKNNNKIRLDYRNGIDAEGKTVYVVIKYTKTTD